jgi:hypothetical protein
MLHRKPGFSYYFCLTIEGSGSGSIPLTNGSGWPKNNTDPEHCLATEKQGMSTLEARATAELGKTSETMMGRLCSTPPMIAMPRSSAGFFSTITYPHTTAVSQWFNQCCGSMTFLVRIRVRGSMPLSNGSRSCYFHHGPSRCQQKTNFFPNFSCLFFF